MKKAVLIGIGIFVFGFIVSALCGGFFANGDVEHSYYYGIIFSVLYLSSIVGVATSLILSEMKCNRK